MVKGEVRGKLQKMQLWLDTARVAANVLEDSFEKRVIKERVSDSMTEIEKLLKGLQ